MFSDLMSCLALSVSTNQISEVEPGTFNGFSALKNLQFSLNSLERLNVDMFSLMNNCTTLSFYLNQISEIEPGGFNGLSNLENLDLNSNHLTALTTDMFQGLVAIQRLEIREYRATMAEENLHHSGPV